MNRYDTIFQEVSAAIALASQDVRPEDVRPEASLIEDMGMDSMRLSALFAEIKRRFGQIDLTRWYVSAARHGADTVGGLVEYLDRAVEGAPVVSLPRTGQERGA